MYTYTDNTVFISLYVCVYGKLAIFLLSMKAMAAQATTATTVVTIALVADMLYQYQGALAAAKDVYMHTPSHT